jgi:hypothetical protein
VLHLAQGRESATDAGDNLFEIQAREAGTRETNADALIIRFPRDIVTEMGGDALVQWLCKMLDPLPHYSGHAGYTLATGCEEAWDEISLLAIDALATAGVLTFAVGLTDPNGQGLSVDS